MKLGKQQTRRDSQAWGETNCKSQDERKRLHRAYRRVKSNKVTVRAAIRTFSTLHRADKQPLFDERINRSFAAMIAATAAALHKLKSRLVASFCYFRIREMKRERVARPPANQPLAQQRTQLSAQ
jgi:hypothetical protein